MISGKINGLKDQICTDDPSNNFIDSGSSPDSDVQWFRLDSNQNCFLTLAKSAGSHGFPDGFCFARQDIIAWINRNALGCNSGDAFFRASPPLNSGDTFAGQGQICLSNFKNYQLCGDTTMNGATPISG